MDDLRITPFSPHTTTPSAPSLMCKKNTPFFLSKIWLYEITPAEKAFVYYHIEGKFLKNNFANLKKDHLYIVKILAVILCGVSLTSWGNTSAPGAATLIWVNIISCVFLSCPNKRVICWTFPLCYKEDIYKRRPRFAPRPTPTEQMAVFLAWLPR